MRVMLTQVNPIELARQASDALFALLTPEAFYERPIAERHRLVFYLGHLEAFDRNLLGRGVPSSRAELDALFAFGIDPTEGDLPTDQPGDWPTRAEVAAYCLATRSEVDRLLEGADSERLHVALEHRWMHCETLAYLFHRLSYDLKVAPPCAGPADAAAPAVEWRSIPAGPARLGQPRGAGFGWDNEFAELTVELPSFEMESLPVTNGRFAEFVAAGGYQESRWWSEDDWRWRVEAQVERPGFWVQEGERWFYRGMFAQVPLPLSAPVYVSHAEASAYARWRGLALPTEAQYQRAAWGGGELNLASANLDGRHWDPQPVGSDPASDSAFGVSELVGNGWEWTSSLFAPLPGFEPFDFYPGYSADFFDGRHYVLKGASARTSRCLARPAFRNWFQPHYPHVYATFRCVRP